MFLDQRKTKGNERMIAIIIEIKDVFRLALKKTKEIIKAAIPIATFKP